ncbi:MAG: AAA family ATPase, partial [Chloroflexota bacterium]
DMDGISATEAIHQRSPVSQIIMLSVQGDPNYMRRAMLAGARDFLTKPPMADELISAVRRSGENARSERSKASQVTTTAAFPSNQPVGPLRNEGRIIMVYSPKGGSGVTTVAVNLAITLNNEETRAVLVDGNLQFGDVTIFLNEHGKNTILDLAPRSEELDPDIVDEVMVKQAGTGLRILAAPPKPELAENIHSDQFAKVLKYLRKVYPYVVVDCTHNLDDITLATLDACDVLVLVVTQDIPAVKNIRLFIDLMKTIGISKDKICFVLNKYDKRISITPERIGDNLKQQVVSVIPLDERIVIPSVNRGVPFMIDNKTSPIARTIFSLAETVRAHLARLSE